MKRRKKIIFLISGISILLLAGAISFVFNPLGLGPEPVIVLTRESVSTLSLVWLDSGSLVGEADAS